MSRKDREQQDNTQHGLIESIAKRLRQGGAHVDVFQKSILARFLEDSVFKTHMSIIIWPQDKPSLDDKYCIILIQYVYGETEKDDELVKDSYGDILITGLRQTLDKMIGQIDIMPRRQLPLASIEPTYLGRAGDYIVSLFRRP